MRAPAVNNGLVMSMTPDPGTILQDGTTKIHIDVTNTDIKKLDNVNVVIFNPGLLLFADGSSCAQSGVFGTLQSQEFRTFSCDLKSNQINQDRLSTTINAKANFTTTFSAVQQMGLITEEEYNNRLATSGVQQQPTSYVYGDRNIQLQVDFSDTLPIVVKDNRKVYVKFTLRNIGNGFVNSIGTNDIQILQKPSLDTAQEGNVLQSADGRPCHLVDALYPIGNTFPSFSCQVVMPSGINPIASYDFIINVKYTYEIRAQTQVDIVR